MTSPGASSPPAQDPEPFQDVSAQERVVLEYLRARGYSAAEKVVLESINASSSEEKEKAATIAAEELVKTLAVFTQTPSRPGENALKDSSNVLQELSTLGNPANLQNLIARIGNVGAEEILSLDPTDKQEGFRELEAWVEGSLDMYQVSFLDRDLWLSDLHVAGIPTNLIPHLLPFLPGSNSARLQGCWSVQKFSKVRGLSYHV